MARSRGPRRRASARGRPAPARPRRYRGFSYGGWSFREPLGEPSGAIAPARAFPRITVAPRVWGVRVDFHPLGLEPDDPRPPALPLRIPPALADALDGLRELRGEPDRGGWQLYRDGRPIGRVSRPAAVPMVRVLGRAGSGPPGPTPI